MALLTLDQIFNADDRHRKTVTVPEWGGEITLRSLSAGELSRYRAGLMDADKVSNQKVLTSGRAQLLALSIVDENDDPMFGDEGVEVLSRKSGGVIDRLYGEALALNAMTKESVEKLEKNSEPTPVGDSCSD